MKAVTCWFVGLCWILSGSTALAKVTVVATIPDFASIAQEVGGEFVEATAMVKPTQDPHFVDAKPSLVLELNRADLLLLAGMELEAGWLPPLLRGSRNSKIQRGSSGYLECATLIPPLQVRAADRSQGDVHPGGNPHFWIDPRNGVRIARGVADRLALIDAEHADAYRQGAQRFVTSLEARMVEWQKLLAPVKGRKVVVYHESWVYFLDWAGLEQAGTLEPKPGIAPSPTHVADLIRRVQGQGIQCVIQESFYPTQLSSIFSQKSGAQLKVLPTMVGAAGTRHYADVIDQLVRGVVQ